MSHVRTTPLAQLKSGPGFDQLSDSTLVKILTFKVEQLEPAIKAIKTKPVEKQFHLVYGRGRCPADLRDTGSHKIRNVDFHAIGSKDDCLPCVTHRLKQIEKICAELYV